MVAEQYDTRTDRRVDQARKDIVAAKTKADEDGIITLDQLTRLYSLQRVLNRSPRKFKTTLHDVPEQQVDITTDDALKLVFNAVKSDDRTLLLGAFVHLRSSLSGSGRPLPV